MPDSVPPLFRPPGPPQDDLQRRLDECRRLAALAPPSPHRYSYPPIPGASWVDRLP